MKAQATTGLDTVSLARWAEAAAGIIAHIDDEDLPLRLFAAIAEIVPYDLASCYVYRGRAKPFHIGDTFSRAKAGKGPINYVNNTYVLNPVYNAYLRGLESGVYRIRDLAPDAYFESGHYKSLKATASASEEIGYITDDWPKGMEEVLIAMALPDGEMGEISLLRPVRRGGFGAGDLETLEAIRPTLAAAFARYWARVRGGGTHATPDTAIDDAFSRFGGEVLSPREREVAQLVLRGHSTHSVGAHLGISVTTVKTHRKHLYAKLGISSQFELFSKFLDSLVGDGV